MKKYIIGAVANLGVAPRPPGARSVASEAQADPDLDPNQVRVSHKITPKNIIISL